MGQGLQHQSLLGGDQQGRQIRRLMPAGQGRLRLGGGDQIGQPLAETLHERLAALPGRAGSW